MAEMDAEGLFGDSTLLCLPYVHECLHHVPFALAATDVINPAINAAAGGFGEGGNVDEEAESGVLRAAKRERKARIRAMRGKSSTPPSPATAAPWRLCCCRRVSLSALPVVRTGLHAIQDVEGGPRHIVHLNSLIRCYVWLYNSCLFCARYCVCVPSQPGATRRMRPEGRRA